MFNFVISLEISPNFAINIKREFKRSRFSDDFRETRS